MELTSCKIKICHTFSKKKSFLIVQETELSRKWNFLASRLNNKNILYFEKCNFLALRLKNFSWEFPSSKTKKDPPKFSYILGIGTF